MKIKNIILKITIASSLINFVLASESYKKLRPHQGHRQCEKMDLFTLERPKLNMIIFFHYVS